MTGSPWMPPGYEPPIFTDPWECDEPGCTNVAADRCPEHAKEDE